MTAVRMLSYRWTCPEGEARIRLPLPTPVLDHYRSLGPPDHPSAPLRHLAMITDPVAQHILRSYIDIFRHACGPAESKQELLLRLITFVQHLPHSSRPDPPHPPLEVLDRAEGVCSDFSLLLAALLYAVDHPAVLVYFTPRDGPGARHMAVGVADTGKFTGTCLSDGKRDYVLVETTGRVPIGQCHHPESTAIRVEHVREVPWGRPSHAKLVKNLELANVEDSS